ncbi:MAG: methionyl-tRNA formyltransferase, partial [Clostridia bacterium]|nr:methionyl-tRNA formyltransferase [Clostridia bacterium]
PEREYENGEVVCVTNKLGLIVKCQNGFVRLKQIQPQSSKLMKDTDFLNGRKIPVGTKLLLVNFEK